MESCDYMRQHLFDAVMTAVLTSALAARKKLLFATGEIPDPLSRRAHSWLIADSGAGSQNRTSLWVCLFCDDGPEVGEDP
jgi:hypothetical protein